ncbi:hypothetical protein LLH00_04655 [bacterium]|nr:hypothetical protein [bacterium]
MRMDPLDMQMFSALLVLLVVLYFWVRHVQSRQRCSRKVKEHCRDLILDNRHALAAAGVDIEGLVNLVRMDISCEQLDAVIKLLLRPRRQYDIDRLDAPGYLEVDLDLDREPVTASRSAATVSNGVEKSPAGAPGADTEPAAAVEGQPEEESAADSQRRASPDRMEAEEEKTWLKLAHNRFRDAITKRGISDRRARLRLLVRMVELGKRAVDEDISKSGARKEYERGLWDRFYENEYLQLNSE